MSGDVSGGEVLHLLLVDEPYVSPFLRETIESCGLPLVLTERARELGFAQAPHVLDEAEAVARAAATERLLVYTCSENSIGWLSANLASTALPGLLARFKDKAEFRRLVAPLDPGYFFRQVSLDELAGLDVSGLPLPLILKPNVGFFSLGVQRIDEATQWDAVVRRVHDDVERATQMYPREVIDMTSFLLEECIEGEEFAVDAFLDAEGTPVLTGIWKHEFSAADDTSDRIYFTSRELIEELLPLFTEQLSRIANLTGARDMPLHAEFRRDAAGVIRTIEVNPLRFGGWCTTADMTAAAFGFNPYQLFFEGRAPDWDAALEGKQGKLYSIVVLDNSTGLAAEDIESFDYERLLAGFQNPLELRKIDFRRFPLFGFLFLETLADDRAELDRILHSDLREFVRTR